MRRLLSVFVFLTVIACTTTTGNRQAATGNQPTTSAKAAYVGPHGFDLAGAGSAQQKLGDFYAACMNVTAINQGSG